MSAIQSRLGEGELTADILSAANIHPKTGLATDYLNHFNEVVMLLEMLPDMPDCEDDVLAWEPSSYADHFQRTGFVAKDLAISAYEAVPLDLKTHFETLVERLNVMIESAQDIVRSNQPDRFEKARAMVQGQIQPLLQAAGGAIHGRIEDHISDESEETQDSIDALFD